MLFIRASIASLSYFRLYPMKKLSLAIISIVGAGVKNRLSQNLNSSNDAFSCFAEYHIPSNLAGLVCISQFSMCFKAFVPFRLCLLSWQEKRYLSLSN
ncbi:hypothetical protein DSECCO2_652500 [anaerobic digester metagenome]